MKDIVYLTCENEDYVGDSLEEKYSNYTLENCVIIRTTNIFPHNKVIETPFNAKAHSYAESSILGETIIEKVKKEINFKPFDEESRKTLRKELKKYQVAFETMRTTIHFTINGLVSSHLYGNFDNRDYIIIDPLKYHLQNQSLKSLRVEDTYFNDNLQLSDEAVIIIKEEKFNEIKNNSEYMETLSTFKIFVYKGQNEQLAVKEALNYLGYDSFIVNDHGYVNGISEGTAANKMYNYIADIREKQNISGHRHFDSQENIKDSLIREEKAQKTDLEHFIYIISNTTYISNELKEKIFIMLEKDKIKNKELDELAAMGLFEDIDEYRNANIKQIAKKVIEIIPLEEIERLTKEFNQQFIENLKISKNNKSK